MNTMQGNPPSPTPFHLWLVGILSLLWNLVGVFDNFATLIRLEFYMSEFTREQLDYFYAFPQWANIAWTVGVWSALLGSVSLLLKRRWAVGLFGLSLVAMAVTSVYTLGMTNGLEIMGDTGLWFTIAIWAIAIFLFLYARSQAANKTLR